MKTTLTSALVLLSLTAGPVLAQRGRERPQPAAEASQAEGRARIAWFGRWADAKAEAARTGRPILLMSAAPQCSGAPGMW